MGATLLKCLEVNNIDPCFSEKPELRTSWPSLISPPLLSMSLQFFTKAKRCVIARRENKQVVHNRLRIETLFFYIYIFFTNIDKTKCVN